MSCCGGNHSEGPKQGQEHQHGAGGNSSHKWMMMICCVLPIVLVAILFLTNSAKGSVGSTLPLLLVLLCPLSHLIIMPLMSKKKKNQHT